MSSELMIEMKNVHKWFGELHVLNDINLEINKGEKIVICGPSGSGKSTLIRCINRLEEHQRGNIIVEGTELTNDSRSCLLYTSPSPRDGTSSRMPSSA